YELPAEVELVELPHYRDLTHPGEVARSVPGTIRAMWRGLERVDVVWAFGPHPFAIVLALLALLRRKRLVLGVRQDTLGYYRNRAGSGSRGWGAARSKRRPRGVPARSASRRLSTFAATSRTAPSCSGSTARRARSCMSRVPRGCRRC